MKKRKSGILCHISSLPSDFGIGDFGSGAYDFVDFLERSKQSLWQVLPMGMTGLGNSPYQCFSSFAGNVFFISPGILFEKGYISEKDLKKAKSADFYKVDYDEVRAAKGRIFEKAFFSFSTGATEAEKQKYLEFCAENDYWLSDYSLFMSLKEYFIKKRKEEGKNSEYKAFLEETPYIKDEKLKRDYYLNGAWISFPKDLRQREAGALKEYSYLLRKETEFNKFLQFELFSEWNEIKKYANLKGIEIIGDMPIFPAYDSADVWAWQKGFDLDAKGFPVEVSGVPPDYFSEKGQLWGNPLYVWKEHKKDGYKWWVNRLSHAFKLTDYVRIDHFRGFVDFWAVPFGSEDALGGKWKEGPKAEIFEAFSKKNDLDFIITEDLGIITDEVVKLKKEFGFFGMEVLQFAFEDDSDNCHLPHNHEKESVVYTGTHDNNTTAAWYQGLPEEAKDRFRRYLNSCGESPAYDLMRAAFISVSQFAIIPIQDVLGLGEECRMNIPGTPKGNWEFRLQEGMLGDITAESLRYLSKLFKRNEK
ncbi:MAG: 4-alpha-glucanotransferase [Lachnospiraceae bacterium]|nr:4-alpha-glucanotransferase [Lachnospiraceae bacterium]